VTGIWNDVDEYVIRTLVRPDDALEQALASTEEAGMPAIAVSAPQGKLLHLLARMVGARRILEIGTLGGYSTIWMARALPQGGRLISLELSERHAEVARANLERAGLSGVAEVRVGPALDTLPTLAGEQFDLVFIDADKTNIPQYFDWAVRLSRPGAAIVVDNVVRDGGLVDPSRSEDPSVAGVRAFHEQLARRGDVSATTVQTVGAKGYDGFTLAIVDPAGG
jgi:predicted O-methyltransferase YrrM